ncbi:feruloyl-CoA synthase [Derxia gummosa]|uniref:Feruloyl-CoA synthase n=1 Tax=Derxia gummosa DSM 723 TaxID=1121388 RepID=A0A8B6X9J4_9BURK|nr:feruloyl-CoA synthase [Derxia gummosa]
MRAPDPVRLVERDPATMFATPDVIVHRRPDGGLILESGMDLPESAPSLGERLEHWARVTPEAVFLAERADGGGWREVSYADALRQVRAIAGWLLARGASADRPVVVLSDNSVDHALMMFAAMHVGVPVASISSAYSLLSKDHAKLRQQIALVAPGVIYASDSERYGAALASIADLHDASLVTSARVPAGAVAFAELTAFASGPEVDAAFSLVGPDTVAKLLFTSGSTSIPKAVVNTQRMLCTSQAARLRHWPFLQRTPPVVADWLPWSHTFGGNHNFNLVLCNGGTMVVDAGRPAPGLFETTLANLREVRPTVYFNVPRGFDMLVAALQQDDELRCAFFSRLQVIFYAAAALPQHLWAALDELAHRTVGCAVPIVSGWGSTETSPLSADAHFVAERAGVIGLPVPGTSLRLVPVADKYEIRVKGPNVMPGYLRNPALTAEAFDEEGYYRIGDTVRFADPARPERGLTFEGRLAEDFKLATGTWVRVGTLRLAAIDALKPVAQDVIVAGHDRDEIGLLVVPNVAASRRLATGLPADAPLDDVLAHPALRALVADGLARMRAAGGGSSSFATRALLLAEPLSIDAGEITDKAYINQRRTLETRAAEVERLYAETADAGVIALEVVA